MNRLEVMLNPKTVALIGATEKRRTVGRTILENLLQAKERKVFPVNPAREKVLDLESYPRITAVPEHVDLAVVATPARSVPEVVDECGQAGVEGVLMISGGFEEIGEEGKRLKTEVQRFRKKYGMRILGPNCLGFMRPALGLNASFLQVKPPPGDVAFLSQSRALGSAILDWAVAAGVGFSTIASLGSMVDVDFGDMIDFLGDDGTTRSILIYMERVGDARKFMSAARGFARRKPIVVLKPGRFGGSAKTAHSLTGAMAIDDAVYDAAFRRAGAVRVREIGELFAAAEVLDSKRLPSGPRLAIVTSAGALGFMAADSLIHQDGELAELSQETVNQLDALLPPHWSKANPIDILGDATVDRFMNTVRLCLSDPAVDGVLVIYVPMDYAPSARLAQALAEASKNTWKPVIAAWMGGKAVQQGKAILVENDIPVYENPEESVRAYLNMCSYKRNLDQLYETPHELPVHEAVPKERMKKLLTPTLTEGRTLLTEEASKELLTAYGIPVNAARRGRDPQEAMEGAAVGQMITEADYELILRAKKHKDFGTVILFGMGGAAGEFIKDFSIGLPPLNQTLAKMLIQETKVYKMLQGFRGKPAADLERLEQILVDFSNLIVDFPEIAEIDVDPLAVSNGIPFALGVRIVLDNDYVPGGRSNYPHLVIAPYPTKYIMPWQLSDGTKVLLRPIRPEDEPAEREMLSTLSEETIRTRFFSSIKTITHDWLILLCNVDYDRHIAIVAETRETKKIVGVARLILNADATSGELAVLVHDNFQKKGLGTKFIKILIGIARERGLESVQAQFLVDNENIRKVFKRLGFTTRWLVSDVSEAVLKLKEQGEKSSSPS